MKFSDHVVYVDESGDHSLTSVNPQNPVFVLAFCIVEKSAYLDTIVPTVQRLKFDFWGHDCAILHSHDIRKAHGDFNILLNPHTRTAFLARLNEMITALPFTIIAAVIDKKQHLERHSSPDNPYAIGLAFCLERLQHWLRDRRQADGLTHVIVERRGRTEDAQLELEFRRITDGHAFGRVANLGIRFMDKRHNSTGLQLADLVAHPIGRHVIDPAQSNRLSN